MKKGTESANRFRNQIMRRLPALGLSLCLSFSVLADTTTLTVSSTGKGTSNVPVTLNFPVTRSGDTSYAAVLKYHTQDGTAVAGTDYTATAGSVALPVGVITATIPVTLSAQTGSGANLTFQLQVDSAIGIGPTPSFAAQQTFATGTVPRSVIAADINGDGKPDLIAVNSANSTVSVLLNNTAPGAATLSFTPQQTFATGANPAFVTAADINGDGKADLIVTNYNDATVSVLLNTTAPGAATPSFAAQQTFVTGVNPAFVTTADINGDGKADLIVTNYNDSTVSVLLNTTAPGAATSSFAAKQTFATGGFPYSVTAVDVNGDGKPDLIAANSADRTVSVLLNTTAPGAATPSFAAQQTFATGTDPSSVTTADINGDGKPDLIVANTPDSTVSVLLNTTAPGAATPSFAVQQTFDTPGTSSVTAIDVNGDGKVDLIMANADGTVSVLPNTTAPGAATLSFGVQQIFATGVNPSSVTVADVNGDGKPDLIVANLNDNTVSVLLNTTTSSMPPGFAAQQTFASGSGSGPNPFFACAADINGDGKPDLIIANYTNNTVSVLLNTTVPGAVTPTFATQQTFATGTQPRSVAIVDVNNDGKLDLIVANGHDNNVSVLLNTTAPGAATPSFAAQQTFAAGSFPTSVTAVDVNGDGLADLVVTNLSASTVSVLLNTTAPGAATLSFAARQSFATGAFPYSVTAADVNGDGLADLIVTNYTGGTVSVLLNTTSRGSAAPNFATQQTFATGTNPASVVAADLNGDGKRDLIVANRGDNTVSVLLNTTAPGAATPSFASQSTFTTGNAPFSVTAVDVDGDGKPDLIVANVGDNTVSVLLNTTTPGVTTPSFATRQTFATGTNPYSVTAADLNADGKPDLIAANNNDNTVSVLLNTQYQALLAGNPATGTIVHDYIFADGFE